MAALMGDLVDRARRQCLAAGMEPGEALTQILVSNAEMQEETRRIIEDVARKLASAECGMSPEREKAFAQSADRAMRIHAVQYLRAGSMRSVLIATAALFAVAAACLGGGYLWGNGSLARDQLLAACQTGQVLTAAGGRRYCATWLDPEPGKAH